MKIIYLLAITCSMQESFASSRIFDWGRNKQVQPGSFDTPTKDSKPMPTSAFTRFNELGSNRFKIFVTQETEKKKLSKNLSEKTKEKKDLEKNLAQLYEQVEQERRKIKQAEEDKETLEARRRKKKLSHPRNVPVLNLKKVIRRAKKEKKKDMEAIEAYTRAQNERNETAKRLFKAEKEDALKDLASDIALVNKVIAEANQNCKEYETELDKAQQLAGEMQKEINEIRKSQSFI